MPGLYRVALGFLIAGWALFTFGVDYALAKAGASADEMVAVACLPVIPLCAAWLGRRWGA